jgi:hypothetical protein
MSGENVLDRSGHTEVMWLDIIAVCLGYWGLGWNLIAWNYLLGLSVFM